MGRVKEKNKTSLLDQPNLIEYLIFEKYIGSFKKKSEIIVQIYYHI